MFEHKGEKYSKEALGEATEDVKQYDVPYKETPENFSSRESFEANMYGHFNFVAEAKERVNKLFNLGRKEAVETNEEYNKRVEKFMKGIEDFSIFAVDKLGMKRGQAREVFKEIVNYVLEDTINDIEFKDTAKKE